jgi:hypothetical protein
MGLVYKVDFMACRPWGNRGDRKNDGFLKSKRQLFQVYAPNEMKASEAIRKITEDFEGAKKHWNKHFDKWAFVHNAENGLPPHVQKVLLEFEKENAGVKIEPWGLEELRVVFRKISLEDKQTWLGFAPDNETKIKLGFSDLQLVLESPVFEFPMQGERSKGIKNMQIFCFDLMLMRLCHKQNIGTEFLIHDSHLFDGVDGRQVISALKNGGQTAKELNFQYIVTMNEDDAFKETIDSFDLNDYILPVTLTDATEDGGLFGCRF